MADAVEQPFRAGRYPITELQIDVMATFVADLCRKYRIPVTRRTVLSHAEVQPTLGFRQNAKWDISWLPGMDKLDRLPTISGGRINLAGQDEAVFRVDGALPRTMQTISGDWCYSWSFREVFADEVGGFVERPNTWT